jgi:hypothetical protein
MAKSFLLDWPGEGKTQGLICTKCNNRVFQIYKEPVQRGRRNTTDHLKRLAAKCVICGFKGRIGFPE